MTNKRTGLDRRCPRWVSFGGLVFALLAGAGCPPNPQAVKEVEDKRRLEDRVAELQRDVATRDAQIGEQSARIRELMKTDPQQARYIPHAERIAIEPMTGVYDDNRDGKAEGVVVYLQAFDADGDLVKAAGTATVQVLDLENPAASQVVAEAKLNEDGLRKSWYGKFMTSHFTIKCPWKSGPPTHRVLTVRVRFVDLVTGKPFEAVRQIEVTAATPAATSP